MKLGSLSWLVMSLLCSVSPFLAQAENLCKSQVRTVRLSPMCFLADLSDCPDLCAGMEPAYGPGCFQDAELPCPLVDALGQGKSWLQLSDILRYYRNKVDDSFSSLFLTANELTAADFSALNRVDRGIVSVAKENFKLAIRADALNISRILQLYTSAKIVGAADAFSLEVTTRLAPAYLERIDSYPYSSVEERSALRNEFKAILMPALDQWTKLKQQFSLRTFVDVRRRAVMNRLTKVSAVAQALTPQLQEAIRSLLGEFGAVHCQMGNSESCEIKSLDIYPDEKLLAVDRYLDRLDYVLEALQNHGRVLSTSQDIGTDLSPPPDYGSEFDNYGAASFVYPALLEKTYREFVLKPDMLAFHRLKAAVAAGSYQEFFGAEQIWQTAAATDPEPGKGLALLKPDARVQKLDCEALRAKSERASELQREINRYRAELSLLIRQEGWMLGEGRSRFNILLDWIIAAGNEKISLGSSNMLAFDRLVEFHWLLPDLDLTGSRLYLDFVQIDDRFWNPNLPARLGDILPELDDIASELGSLKDGGMALLGARGAIKLSLRLAPHDACPRDVPVRIIMRIEGPQGVQRVRLEAKNPGELSTN